MCLYAESDPAPKEGNIMFVNAESAHSSIDGGEVDTCCICVDVVSNRGFYLEGKGVYVCVNAKRVRVSPFLGYGMHVSVAAQNV